VVRSEETSGDVTGAALSALATLLHHGVVSEVSSDNTACTASPPRSLRTSFPTVGAVDSTLRPLRPDAAEALSELVDAVSSCRFEFTDSRHDEVWPTISHYLGTFEKVISCG
jgi:hypothetical protein